MTDQKLLTLDEAAGILRLKTGETFARFARRHAIPLVRIGHRVVRVRSQDLDRAIQRNLQTQGTANGRADHAE